MSIEEAVEFVMHNHEVHLTTAAAAEAVTVVAKAAQVLPKIIEYLRGFPGHEIVFAMTPRGEVVELHNGYDYMETIILGDDPGKVVLAALANWTQASEHGGK